MGCQNEVTVVEMLISSGKQRFLIHPLIELFLKEKWRIIGKLYFIYVLLFALFYLSLAGFSVTNYGMLWDDGTKASNFKKDFWW